MELVLRCFDDVASFECVIDLTNTPKQPYLLQPNLNSGLQERITVCLFHSIFAGIGLHVVIRYLCDPTKWKTIWPLIAFQG